jgi:hypothetical protein
MNYTLDVTDDLPIEFDGELVFECSSAWVNGKERSRSHTIALYQFGSSFILHIEYCSRWPGEHDNSLVTPDLASAEAVILALNNYNPTQYLVGFPKSDHFKEKQESLVSQIKADWGLLKGQLIKALGVKRTLKRGQPTHRLGACQNPGWSIPQLIRENVDAEAIATKASASHVATEILAAHFGLLRSN